MPRSTPLEPLLAFTAGAVQRNAEHRNDDDLRRAILEDGSVWLVMDGARVVIAEDAGAPPGGTGTAPQTPFPFLAARDLAHLQPLLPSAILLGRNAEGRSVLVVQSGVEADALPAGFQTRDLRSLIVGGMVNGPASGDLAHGAAMMNWHRANSFCARCGAQSLIAAGGAKRACSQCKAEHFPRTDPVAIMMVTHGGRALLGRSPHFPPGMHSCLAGFVEPGETIEEAVRRETKEEAGITVGRVTYVASQPWPMPHSLMIGCHGDALSDDVAFDATELEACRWFTKEEIEQMLDGTHPDGLTAPLRGAIARHLMARFVESPEDLQRPSPALAGQ
jgi:NAD+ diphosphatase